MPRIARIVGIGLPHHITQRGNYCQNIFSNDEDRKIYLSWIQDYSIKYRLSIVAYCLMLNHVHFVAIPFDSDSLAKTFNVTHMRYSQYFNKKLNKHGHLWQGRFYSCVLDDPHFILAVRYIERNPVRAELVSKPWHWQWSSAAEHIGQNRDNNIKLESLFEKLDVTPDYWKDYLDIPEKIKLVDRIRKSTLVGRPLGSKLFISNLEIEYNRKFLVSPVGRPRNS